MSGTRSRSAGATSTYDCSRSRNWSSPTMQQRRVALEQHHRVVRIARRRSATGGWARSGRAASASMTRAARSARRSSMAGSPDDGARTRPSMIGRSNSAYCGPYSSMSDAAAIDQVQLSLQPARARSACRSDTNTSTVDGSDAARAPTSATHGESSSRCRYAGKVRGQDVGAAQAVDERLHLAGREPHVAAHRDAANLQRRRADDEVERAIRRVDARRSPTPRQSAPARHDSHGAAALALCRA